MQLDSTSGVVVYGASLLAAGVASGFAGGLFGIGGGLLRVPIFLYLFPLFGMSPGIAMHLAAGTSLALAIPTGLGSARAQQRAGNLDAGFLRSWIPALVVGVAVGLGFAHFVSSGMLEGVFAAVVVVAGLQMLLAPPDFRLRPAPPTGVGRAALALAIGTVSSMVGITGGVLTTPSLTALGLPIHRCVAISAAGGVAIALVGAAGSIVSGLGAPGRGAFALGYVDVLAVAIMTPAVLVSAPLGVRVANRLSQKHLQRAFGLLMLVVAADLIRGLLVGS